MNLLLNNINCKYPNILAINKGKNNAGASIKQNKSKIKGIHFIGIRQGIQQKVVYWSGFCDTCIHINIMHIGNNPKLKI